MKFKLLAIILAACSISAFASEQTHWSYEGNGAPQNWSKISPEFSECTNGKNQSPVDIHNSFTVHATPLSLSYLASPESIVNNGHSVQVNVPKGDTLIADGETFTLQQFHFHSPSENTIDGKSFPMEAHFVHTNAAGEIAVVAVMFNVGDENKELAKIWEKMPSEHGKPANITEKVNLAKLLPAEHNHYRFSGSLTTPPCTEGVRWLVMKQPQTLSEAQLEKFQHAMHHANNRPVQDLHGRVIVAE
ncbi:carbonic anhydrase [Rahnella inusitata]|uniref:Carbonic anhydrase n=1 Tax=Rahnella inusitata TaxID=58169 RepID=A0ABX9NXS5_9GAMM|nr:carbonic anhydrase family protein [Rahnella inusitata]RJT11429.1 carbonic anhydrase family protein [Rahnella inusitata]